jgi:hypoxanthine-DNA glycosylase
MRETHPFGNFVPPNTKYLILGSFTGKEAVKDIDVSDDAYDFFYGTKRNQFWPILEKVYGIEIKNKQAKQALLAKLGIAMADIIFQCERRDGNNLDANLDKIVDNMTIVDILNRFPIERILFTSRFVEIRFRRVFKETISLYPACELITLPSPSPRFATMSKEQKISRYKELLPRVSEDK